MGDPEDSELSRRPDLFTQSLWMHPLVQTDLVLSGDAGRQSAGFALRDLQYGAERSFIVGYQRALGFDQLTRILTIHALAYGVISVIFLWRAKCQLRRRVF